MATSSQVNRKQAAAIPRLALTKREAASALGLSVDSFERHVQPELRVVRRGRLRLFALSEVERWLRENGTKTLEDLDLRA
jgi:excisionase family DNA binding protein